MIHKFIKNLLFVLIIGSASIGLLYGISILMGGETRRGIVVTIIAFVIAVLSFIFAAYYHKRDIHVNGYGIIGAITAAIIGIYYMVTSGSVDSITFLKIGIISVTLGLHAMATEKFGFFMQKAGIGVALISLAFCNSVTTLGIGIAGTFTCFCLSIFFNPFLQDAKPATLDGHRKKMKRFIAHLVRFLYRIGLTNLSDEELEQFCKKYNQ